MGRLTEPSHVNAEGAGRGSNEHPRRLGSGSLTHCIVRISLVIAINGPHRRLGEKIEAEFPGVTNRAKWTFIFARVDNIIHR